jgi:predicted phage baseplate assembly protein
MPIESPQLDDLRYDRVVEDLVRRIPMYAPEWTDHNDSDPGITLIHLFGQLAEQVGYRLNLVPEKMYIELLKLLGTRLLPAHAARTTLAFLISDPSTLVGLTLPKGAKANAQKGDPPPSFETDADIDIVPAESRVVVSTKNPDLRHLRRHDDGTEDPVSSVPDKPKPNETEWLYVSWDGENPKFKDMPLEPPALAPRLSTQQHAYLWIGFDANLAPNAGFRGARVTLSIQFDDDEVPDPQFDCRCDPIAPAAEPAPPPIDWLAYYDAADHAIKNVPGRIVDGTARLTRSGTIRFQIPLGIGPIPEDEFEDLRPEVTVSAVTGCTSVANTLKTRILAGTLVDVNTLPAALTTAISDAQAAAAATKPPVLHPLDPKLRKPDKVRGWLRITLGAPLVSGSGKPRLRMVTFNAAPAINATTAGPEILGTSDGTPGQVLRLARGNVLIDSLKLAIQESSDSTTPLTTWTMVDSLDGAGPFDRVFTLDAEAGLVTFGDGQNGRVPPLVPRGGTIVALTYRYGGGKAGEVGAGAITALESQTTGVAAVTNPVPATGGRDAETLEQAKRRARKQLSTRSRAVTRDDFEWIALQTETVRVARAQVVPLRVPLVRPPGVAPTPAAIATPRCGPPLPAGRAGLDSRMAPGAVSVVVVPDTPEVAEPEPAPSFLRAVCEQLDQHRLVTTEVHVVPPQYCRLCNFVIGVKARAGYTRARLQDIVEARLATYLHILRGGDDGKGFPFGAQVHVADLMAQIFRCEGVERVDSVRADFTRSKSNVEARQGVLLLCPAAVGETDEIQLEPEENVSFDSTTFTLSTVV